LRGVDLNHRPLGYEPNELPDCSTPQFDHSNGWRDRQTMVRRARMVQVRAMTLLKELGRPEWKKNSCLGPVFFSKRDHSSSRPCAENLRT